MCLVQPQYFIPKITRENVQSINMCVFYILTVDPSAQAYTTEKSCCLLLCFAFHRRFRFTLWLFLSVSLSILFTLPFSFFIASAILIFILILSVLHMLASVHHRLHAVCAPFGSNVCRRRRRRRLRLLAKHEWYVCVAAHFDHTYMCIHCTCYYNTSLCVCEWMCVMCLTIHILFFKSVGLSQMNFVFKWTYTVCVCALSLCIFMYAPFIQYDFHSQLGAERESFSFVLTWNHFIFIFFGVSRFINSLLVGVLFANLGFCICLRVAVSFLCARTIICLYILVEDRKHKENVKESNIFQLHYVCQFGTH